MEWKTIETAPRDGTHIRVRVPGFRHEMVVGWFGGLLGENDKEAAGWHAISERYPDCWTDGICWAVNAEMEPSKQPNRWKPFPTEEHPR